MLVLVHPNDVFGSGMQPAESAATLDLIEFEEHYEAMSEADFQQYVVRAGLQDNGDLKLLRDLITASGSILLVGGAYGRELKQFQEWNLLSNIVCVEKVKKHVEHMAHHYGDLCEVIHEDILHFTSPRKFDLVLILFGTISEFSESQAMRLYKRLSSMLAPDGAIVIDTLVALDNDTRFSEHDNDSYVFTAYGKSIKARASCKASIHKDVRNIPLKINSTLHYVSPTNIARNLVFLTLS